jgi:hypothetical protein
LYVDCFGIYKNICIILTEAMGKLFSVFSIVISILLLLLNHGGEADESLEKLMMEKLKSAQAKINAEEEPHCYDRSNSKKHYESGTYDRFGLEGTNTLVYPFCLKTKELGNKLGNYFTELACAHAVGLNFVTVHKQWDLEGAHTNITDKSGQILSKISANDMKKKSKIAFLEGLPQIIVHPTPVATVQEGRSQAEKLCKCNRYCWQDPHAPWVNQTSIIATTLRKAIKSYTDSIPEVMAAGTVLSADTDMTNAKPDTFLPIVPDVAIQYRCGDNIGFNYMYGLLPFFAFPSRIPTDSKTIYVLSDHPTRSQHATYSGRCQLIQEALFGYLKKKFPDAIVVVKRGGDLFLDYARLTDSKVTICSASTYCLWPAIAHKHAAYFPLTSLIGNADNVQLANVMTTLPKTFHWIEDPLLISDLRKFRPWYAIVDYLKGDIDRPAGTR